MHSWRTIFYILALLFFVITCILWGVAMTGNVHLEGVAVYSLKSGMPNLDGFVKKTNRDTFAAEASMLPYCVFPNVYKALTGENVDVEKVLKDRLGDSEGVKLAVVWRGIDFGTWDNPPGNDPYNLPYEDVKLNPQYFDPMCNCINQVLGVYRQGRGTYEGATAALKACVATHRMIRHQALEAGDANITAYRKMLARHSLLFNLCTAIFFTVVYNLIDFSAEQRTYYEFVTANLAQFLGMLVCFALPLLSPLFSFAAVSTDSAMKFSAITYLPAAGIFFLVEYMWSIVAKANDVRRQAYLHPYSFYVTLVNLFLIALIENGVFTYEVLLTYVFLSNVVALAYAAVLFAAHGRVWQGEEVKGYLLLLSLIGLVCVSYLIPMHPINSRLNYLWLLPMVFVFMCVCQIVFLEGLFKKTEDAKQLHFSNSVHLLNMGHVIITGLVLLYYANTMQYARTAEQSFTETGGRLDQRLNFELAELMPVPSYRNPSATGAYMGT